MLSVYLIITEHCGIVADSQVFKKKRGRKKMGELLLFFFSLNKLNKNFKKRERKERREEENRKQANKLLDYSCPF